MSSKLSVREATPADLPAVTRLLSRRDGCQRDLEAVRNFLFGLEPELLRAWIAWVGDEPVGLTTVYVRTLEFAGVEKKAGYWAHLFVDEDYRRLMVFPRLLIAMVRGASAGGLELLYTITRQSKLAEASGKFGFSLVAKQPALIRPVRPLGLAAKQFGLPAVFAAAAAPLDRLYAATVSRLGNSPFEIDDVEISSPECGDMAAILHAMGEGSISQHWTLEQFRRRFRTTIDGDPYTLLLARRDGVPVAGLISRLAERGNHVRVGVIVEACWRSDEIVGAQALARYAQRKAYEGGAEVMLTMDSLGAGTGSLAARLGYFRTSELHHFLLWDRDGKNADGFGTDPKHWRFSYSDHDAF